MINKERDTLDDLFQNKLQNLEVDTRPEDWDAIESRLTKAKVVPLHKRWYYGAAAAAVLALFVGGGSYYLSRQPAPTPLPVAQELKQDTTPIEDMIIQDTAAIDSPAIDVYEAETVSANTSRAVASLARKSQPVVAELTHTPHSEAEISMAKESPRVTISPAKKPLLIAGASPVYNTGSEKRSPQRKWGFGAGLGGLAQGSTNTVPTYLLRSSSLEDERLLALNAVTDQNQGNMPKTNIKHKTPISFGFSVSRYLNDRFSFQTGLTYTLLRSDWETQGIYKNLTRQNLHFVGIPLSLSYKIAQWKRLMVYASAGIEADINVGGQERTKSYSGETQTGTSHTNVRMKEWQWSLNAHAGVSYPIFRPLHAFAEIGAAYYFDNGSEMETVFSDKPFNLSPQLGFRLSF